MQSEHKPSTSSFEVIEAQVSPLDASPATPRRRWSAAAKDRIVAAASEPGANVSALARSNGLSPQQIFTWRRQASNKRGKRDLAKAAGPSFAMVALDGAGSGVVEIVVGEVTLRFGPSVPAGRVKEILQAVRSA